jgi:hypothetical protein
VATGPIHTERLELSPLPPAAAAALPERREAAEDIIGAELSSDWPQPDLLKILPRHATTAPEHASYGIWVMIESGPRTVIGDLGFHGPPENGVVEIGYAVIPKSSSARLRSRGGSCAHRLGASTAGSRRDRRRMRREQCGFDSHPPAPRVLPN